jgi:hypothetical protein
MSLIIIVAFLYWQKFCFYGNIFCPNGYGCCLPSPPLDQ